MKGLPAFPFGPNPAGFHDAFGVGGTSRKIHPVDACGVMLASVQALHELGREQDADIEDLHKKIREARSALATVRKVKTKHV